jgi:hypothetical protein
MREVLAGLPFGAILPKPPSPPLSEPELPLGSPWVNGAMTPLDRNV